MSFAEIGVTVPWREDIVFTVTAKRRRTPVIVELLLHPLDRMLDYLPGQYVLLGDPDYHLTVRSFSIANAPRSDGLIRLLVTLVPGGALSTWVHDVLEPGQQVLLSGPSGSFVADPASTDPVLYLAGGSGLAPVRALAEASLSIAGSPPATLFFSARTSADLIDDELFRSWERDQPGFRYLRTLTLSRATGPPPTGRIPDILSDLLPRLDDHRIYIAGGYGFVTACTDAVRSHGARPGRLFTEEFFSDPEPWGTGRQSRSDGEP